MKYFIACVPVQVKRPVRVERHPGAVLGLERVERRRGDQRRTGDVLQTVGGIVSDGQVSDADGLRGHVGDGSNLYASEIIANHRFASSPSSFELGNKAQRATGVKNVNKDRGRGRRPEGEGEKRQFAQLFE